MATQTLYNSCGPYLVNTDWTEEFVEAMAVMSAARGTNITFDEKQAFWLLFQQSGNAGTQYIDHKNVIIVVGQPVGTLSMGVEDDYEIFYLNNDADIVLPGLEGYKFSDVAIGGQLQLPITTQYYHDINTARLAFTMGANNQYVTLTATKLINAPAPVNNGFTYKLAFKLS